MHDSWLTIVFVDFFFTHVYYIIYIIVFHNVYSLCNIWEPLDSTASREQDGFVRRHDHAMGRGTMLLPKLLEAEKNTKTHWPTGSNWVKLAIGIYWSNNCEDMFEYLRNLIDDFQPHSRADKKQQHRWVNRFGGTQSLCGLYKALTWGKITQESPKYDLSKHGRSFWVHENTQWWLRSICVLTYSGTSQLHHNSSMEESLLMKVSGHPGKGQCSRICNDCCMAALE
jgi:hypothetical protein